MRAQRGEKQRAGNYGPEDNFPRSHRRTVYIENACVNYFVDIRMLIDSKAAVAAQTLRPGTSEMPLPTGDMIHNLNSTTVASMADLREGMAKLAPRDAVVLPIERYGQLV